MRARASGFKCKGLEAARDEAAESRQGSVLSLLPGGRSSGPSHKPQFCCGCTRGPWEVLKGHPGTDSVCQRADVGLELRRGKRGARGRCAEGKLLFPVLRPPEALG